MDITRVPTILNKHRLMLSDSVRNKLLYQAMKSQLNENTDFLDIGSGTGVWAILAAKLGARRVVAIEVEECLIPIIRNHAKDNGVADKIEIIHSNSNDVEIAGKFNLIVSEIFGDDVFNSGTIKDFVNLRNRFLSPGGTLIPHKLALFAAPVHIQNPLSLIPAAGLPLLCEFFKNVQLNFSQNLSLAERESVEFLGEAKMLTEIDFRTVNAALPSTNFSCSWKLDNLNKANAIVTFTKSFFDEHFVMNNFESQSWSCGVYEFIPNTHKSGEITFNLDTDPVRRNWSLSIESDEKAEKQSYAPVFAVGHLKSKV